MKSESNSKCSKLIGHDSRSTARSTGSKCSQSCSRLLIQFFQRQKLLDSLLNLNLRRGRPVGRPHAGSSTALHMWSTALQLPSLRARCTHAVNHPVDRPLFLPLKTLSKLLSIFFPPLIVSPTKTLLTIVRIYSGERFSMLYLILVSWKRGKSFVWIALL